MLLLRRVVFLSGLWALMAVPVVCHSAPLDIEQQPALLFALESLGDDVDKKGRLTISSAADTLNLTFTANFSLSSKPKYIRLDLHNGSFENNFSATGLVVDPNYTSTLISGGQGDTSLIIEVRSPTLLGRDTRFTLASDSFKINDITQPLSVTYTLYDKASAALYDGAFITRFSGEIAKVIAAFGAQFTQSFNQAVSFDEQFLRFKPSYRAPSVFALGDSTAELASLGKFRAERLILDDVLQAATALPINDFRDLLPEVDTSKEHARIKGDFSTLRAFLNQNDDCSGASHELANYSSDNEVWVAIDTLVAFPVLCAAIERHDRAIKRSAYELDLGVGIAANLFGEISYAAAAIDLPYITDYAGYRQRILLVNHAGYDVAYTTQFVAEPGVQAHYIEGDKVTGIIPAGSTLKLTPSDLISIDPSVASRISARIFIDAKAKDIAAAVQILSPGSDAPPITNVLTVLEN